MISLPPDITFEKRSLPGGGWSYDFRHRGMGALGRRGRPDETDDGVFAPSFQAVSGDLRQVG